MKQSFTKHIDAGKIADGIIREAERAELLQLLNELAEYQEKVARTSNRITKILMKNKR